MSALGARYGLGGAEPGVRLAGGFANDLFRIDTDAGPRVLRLERPPVDERDLAWEHDVVRRLAERLPETCAPLTDRDGGTWFRAGDRVACLLPLVTGKPADPPAGHAREIASERGWAIDAVRRIAAERAPRTGLVHGDFFPGNAMIAGDAVTGVLDWEEAQLDWVSWDLANAIGTFCFDGDDLDRAAARSFLGAYRGAGGTAPPEEEDLLVPLMRVKRILEVLRAPTDRVPRWEHQRGNLRALRRLA